MGAAIAYFMAHINPELSIVVVERETGPARHASGRNTGKVHAPYPYDPDMRSMSARAALVGYSMWKKYCHMYRLPFCEDGVMEVAADSGQAKVLDMHHRWGIHNGLQESDVTILDSRDARRDEPEVRCHAALICNRDASVDYHALTVQLMQDAAGAGARFLPKSEVTDIFQHNDIVRLTLNRSTHLDAGFMVNAAGGRAMRLAHQMGVATKYTNLYFRGEYWRAPITYNTITSRSIYSVPLHREYPFLDPHWIIRTDGRCEVGPNATPVFGPFGYNMADNLQAVLPKSIDILMSGARRLVFNTQFRRLAISEVHSSVSRRYMISRVARFIPCLYGASFKQRGTSGIRAQAVDDTGSFVPDAMIFDGPGSIHILNYNSPGATGALPFAAHIIRRMISLDISSTPDAACGPWIFDDIPHI